MSSKVRPTVTKCSVHFKSLKQFLLKTFLWWCLGEFLLFDNFFFFHSSMSLFVRVILSYLFFSRDVWYKFLWQIVTENKDKKNLKWREWKGKSWLLIIACLRIEPDWLAYKSGRLWLSVSEWIFWGVIHNRYQFFISFPRYCSSRYYAQKLIGKVVAKMVSFFKLCIWQNCKEQSDSSSKRDYAVREICRKYTFTMMHPNIAQLPCCKSKLSGNLIKEWLLYQVSQQ